MRCLRSISETAPAANLQIIVVDNASPDFDRAAVLAETQDAAIIENDTNLGYAAACNQAIELAKAEFVLLCNPDIEFLPGAVDTLREFLRDHRQAAGAAPQLVYPSGRIQASCRGFPNPSALFFEITGLARLFPHSERIASYRMRYFNHATTREVEQPMASCLMLRRGALDDFGHLDERFPVFFNDVDWAMRARKCGWKMYFVAEAKVVHHHGQSTRHMGHRKASESARSLLRLYGKQYRGSISPLAYYPTMGLIAIGGLVRTLALGIRQMISKRG